MNNEKLVKLAELLGYVNPTIFNDNVMVSVINQPHDSYKISFKPTENAEQLLEVEEYFLNLKLELTILKFINLVPLYHFFIEKGKFSGSGETRCEAVMAATEAYIDSLEVDGD